MSSGWLIFGLLFAALAAIAGLLRPFLGLIVFVVIHFVQPGELIPVLAPFRPELVYGALVVAIVIGRRLAKSDPPLLSEPILLGAVLLLGAAILSVPFAVWPGGAINTVIELTKLIILIFLLHELVDSQKRLRTMLWCMVGIGTWFGASSLFAFAHGEFYSLNYNLGNLDRAIGINSVVGGPNELGGVLFALLPLLIALLRTTRSILCRILLWSSGGVFLEAISLTGSRIAIVGLVSISLYYTIKSNRKVRTGLGWLLVGALIWINLPKEYKQRYLSVETYAEGGQLDASNEARIQIWKVGEMIFFRRPIFGVGAGQFPTAYGTMYLKGLHQSWRNPHDLLIQVACELGIVGLVAFIYFFRQIVRGICFVLQKSNCSMSINHQVGIACSIMCFGILILSTVGHTLYRPYWYLLAGLVAANRNLVTKQSANVKTGNEQLQQQSLNHENFASFACLDGQ